MIKEEAMQMILNSVEEQIKGFANLPEEQAAERAREALQRICDDEYKKGVFPAPFEVRCKVDAAKKRMDVEIVKMFFEDGIRLSFTYEKERRPYHAEMQYQ